MLFVGNAFMYSACGTDESVPYKLVFRAVLKARPYEKYLVLFVGANCVRLFKTHIKSYFPMLIPPPQAVPHPLGKGGYGRAQRPSPTIKI